MVLFELFGSMRGNGTAPVFFWKKNCSLAKKTDCKSSRCRSFGVLDRTVISLLLLLFHLFAALSNNVARFLTLIANDFSLFSVVLIIISRYSRQCGY